MRVAPPVIRYGKASVSQGKLEKKHLKQMYVFVPRSCFCRRSGLDTHNLFTLGIHRGVAGRVGGGGGGLGYQGNN